MPNHWYYDPITLKEVWSSSQPEGFVKGRLPYDKWPEERKKSYKEKHKINPLSKLSPERYEEFCLRSYNNMKGKVWYTNGYKNVALRQGTDIPDGFYPGLVRKPTSDILRQRQLHRHRCNNGEKNSWYYEYDGLPEGYVKGWLPRRYYWQK